MYWSTPLFALYGYGKGAGTILKYEKGIAYMFACCCCTSIWLCSSVSGRRTQEESVDVSKRCTFYRSRLSLLT